MGYASYLEDIVERLESDLLAPVRAFLNDGPPLPPDLAARCRAFVEQAEAVKTEVLRMLDLATDPSVDLAYRVATLERENADLRRRAEELEANFRRSSSNAILESAVTGELPPFVSRSSNPKGSHR